MGTGWQGGICEQDILDYLASNKLKITPVARAMAEAEGLDPETITGTGVNGKIMKEDVEKALAEKMAAAAQTAGEAEAGAGERKFSPDGKEILRCV